MHTRKVRYQSPDARYLPNVMLKSRFSVWDGLETNNAPLGFMTKDDFAKSEKKFLNGKKTYHTNCVQCQ